MDTPTDEEVIRPVEEFIDNRLKQELRGVAYKKENLTIAAQDYKCLRQELSGRLDAGEGLPSSMMVDLGSNFYANAAITNRQLVSVAVGFGFFVQLTPEEAVKFCDNKISMLEAQVKHMDSKTKRIQGHIKELTTGIEQLRLAGSNPTSAQHT